MSTMEDYVREFHELSGATESDYLKNFNVYLDSRGDIVGLIGQIVPKSHREEVLLAKMKLKFGTEDQLLETFVQSDRIVGRVLLKSPRFIDIFMSMYPEDFVANVCPRISPVARNNLLHKLCYCVEDSDVAECYYVVLEKRYGHKVATAMLVACGEGFVERVLTTKSVRLSNRQLKYLYGRHPRLVEVYFKEGGDFSAYDSLAQHLCMNDLAMFRRLLEYGKPKVGRRAFVKFIAEFKDDVIKKPGLLPFRHDVMYKCLSKDDFATYFRNLFLANLHAFEDGDGGEIERCLKAVPLRRRGELLFDAFESAYGYPMYSVDDHLKHDVLRLLALDDRLKFNLSPDQVELRDVATAVAAIKAKLNVTQKTEERARLAEKLVRTCAVNDDVAALLDVLRYFCTRHKNDGKGVRMAFVSALESSFQIRRLSDDHCGLILEMLLNFHANDEYYYSSSIWAELFRAKIASGNDYLPLIKPYFKINGCYESLKLDEHPEHEKACIVHYAKIFSDVYQDESEAKYARLRLLEWIGAFNASNPKDELCFYDYAELLESLIAEYEENEYNSNGCVRSLVRQVPRNEDERKWYEKVVRLHLKSKYKYDNNEVMLWLLKHNPSTVSKCVDVFFDHPAVSRRSELYYAVAKMCYTDLPGELKKRAVEVVDAADPKSVDHDKLRACLQYLSFDDTYDFVALAERILPSEDCKVDVNEDSIKEKLAVRKLALKSLKNRRRLSDVVPLALRHCKGDYLQHALEPLYFALHNSAEDSYAEPAAELRGKAVSVRKHGLYLTASLGKPRQVYDELKRWGEDERDASLRKVVFRTMLGKFVELQSDEAWELVEKYVAILDLDDKESVQLLLKLERIPREYLSLYVELAWTQLGDDRQLEVFDAISDAVFAKLDPRIREKLLGTLLFKSKDAEICGRFLSKYLECGGDVNVVLRTYADRLESDLLSGAVRILYDALETACLNEKCAAALPQLLSKLSSDDFNVSVIHFGILVELAQATPTPSALARVLLRQRELVLREFNDVLAHMHGDIVKRTVGKILKDDRSRLELAEELLALDESYEVRALCLCVLPSKLFANKNLRKRHEDVVKKIRHGQSPDMEVMVFHYLRECL